MGIPKNWDRRDSHNPFTFMIELVREDDSVREQIAGAENVVVAQAAFEALPPFYGKDQILRIRQGSRIMDRVNGTDEERQKVMALMGIGSNERREQDG